MNLNQSILLKIQQRTEANTELWEQGINNSKKRYQAKRMEYLKHLTLFNSVDDELNKSGMQGNKCFTDNIAKSIYLKTQSILSLEQVHLDNVKYQEVRKMLDSVEINLKNKIVKLAKYYFACELDNLDDRSGEDWVQKGIDLPKLIFKEAEHKNYLKTEYLDRIQSLIMLIKDNIELLVETIVNYKAKIINSYSKAHSQYLISIATSILFKFQVLKYQVLLDIYNHQNVEVLSRYQMGLKQQSNFLNSKIKDYQNQLEQYNSLDNKFNMIIKMYEETVDKIERVSQDINRLKQ